MVARFLSLLCAFLGLFTAEVSAATCPGTADYTISFYSDWSNTTHPNAYPTKPPDPANGFFSPLTGCSHGSDYFIFNTGIKATPGVKQVAETGGNSVLVAEITNQIVINRKAWALFQANNSLFPTSTTPNIALQVTTDFPQVSAISMIVPSPDWFVGIREVDLCGDDGQWKESYDMTNLQPWDAGTDNGNEFTSGNSANMPAVNIFQITSDMDTSFRVFAPNSIPSLGRIMLKRTNTPTRTSCSGEETYQLNFQGMWSASNHPAGFPSNAHFSQLIGAAHNSTFKIWSPNTRVSPGVEKVAEIGVPGTLRAELNQAKTSGYVHQLFESDSTIPSTGSTTMMVQVKNTFSRVSFISMLAPSPDWFVGEDSIDLCGSDGRWKTGGEFTLPAWDAGTEDGATFSLNNNPTNPVDVVRLITKDSDTVMKGADAIPPFAKVTFVKYEDPTGMTSTNMTSTGMTSTGMTPTDMTSTGMTPTGMTPTGLPTSATATTSMPTSAVAATPSSPTPTDQSAHCPSGGILAFVSIAFVAVVRTIF